MVTALSVLDNGAVEDCSKEDLKHYPSQPTIPQGQGDGEDKEDHAPPRSATSEQPSPATERVNTFRQALSEAAVNNVGKVGFCRWASLSLSQSLTCSFPLSVSV